MTQDSEDDDAPKDLLGDPWMPPRDPRGRRRHKRLPQVAEKVAVLRGSGLRVEDIANRLNLSEPTLRKYYFRELEAGPATAKALLREKMWDLAMAGNVPAAKFMHEVLEKGGSAVPIASRAPIKPREEKLGKKAQADEDAKTAHKGSEWGDLLKH